MGKMTSTIPSFFHELWQYDPHHPLQFSSITFLILFVFIYVIYYFIKHNIPLRNIYLLIFSLFFYYKSSGWYFLLLLSTAWIDFTIAHLIYHQKGMSRKLWMGLSLCINLGVLAYFKYSHFFSDIFNAFFGATFRWEALFLPVGISFFTFQSLSYSIDVYRGDLIPISEGSTTVKGLIMRFLNYCFYISFFPQLVAGPIVRASQFLPQITKPSSLNSFQAGQGLFLFICGLFKKIVLSDTIGVFWVDRVFENPALFSGMGNLLAVYGYTLQIYLDFSGYSDMAIGLALLMGFNLTENFNRPYLATSLQEFWRRWHISLSTWLRDYLYISLGGNRGSKLKTYLNLFLTMVLGGLWHGAGWMFIFWGTLHGLGLALDRLLSSAGHFLQKPISKSFLLLLCLLIAISTHLFFQISKDNIEKWQVMEWQSFLVHIGIYLVILFTIGILMDKWRKNLKISNMISGVFTFHFIAFCWIFFRAGAIGAVLPPEELIGKVLSKLSTIQFDSALLMEIHQKTPYVLPAMLLGFGLHFSPVNLKLLLTNWFSRQSFVIQAILVSLVVTGVFILNTQRHVPFIYFQF
jgi:D-alanyl-lipoteichoic acid acyltransferase DltB (MBOAT superfamily)